MSDLSAQLSAFKNKIKSGPSVIVPRKATFTQSPSSPLSSSTTTTTLKNDANVKKRSTTDSVTRVLKKQKANMGEMTDHIYRHNYTLLLNISRNMTNQYRWRSCRIIYHLIYHILYYHY